MFCCCVVVACIGCLTTSWKKKAYEQLWMEEQAHLILDSNKCSN